MKSLEDKSLTAAFDRRKFCNLTGVAVLSALVDPPLRADTTPSTSDPDPREVRTGNGEWTYRVVPDWGHLPEGITFGGTHGGIAADNAGQIYISTQSTTGVLVYDRQGKLQRSIAHEFPEVHSLVHAEEEGVEYFYTTVQKGTPQENWLFVKMKTDGTVVQRITAPAEAGFKTPNEWRLTAAVPAPDGSIYIANGYGDSRIFRFNKKGEYLSNFSGKGSADGLCNCCHGLALDLRYGQPLLLVCDRENRRLSHFDLEGKFVSHLTSHLRRPCQTSFRGDFLVVSELEGRTVVLDKDNVPVAFLGDNPDRSQWAGYAVAPEAIRPGIFTAAHGCLIDADMNIFVSDWNKTGRITKLERIGL